MFRRKQTDQPLKGAGPLPPKAAPSQVPPKAAQPSGQRPQQQPAMRPAHSQQPINPARPTPSHPQQSNSYPRPTPSAQLSSKDAPQKATESHYDDGLDKLGLPLETLDRLRRLKLMNNISHHSLSRLNSTVANHLMPTYSDTFVRIAVLDTGFDGLHTDFSQPRTAYFTGPFQDLPQPEEYEQPQLTRIKAYHDFCQSSPPSSRQPPPPSSMVDLAGHGTAITGLILRLAPQAELYIGRVCHGVGSNELSTPDQGRVAAAIKWAISQKVHIINLSLGYRNQPLGDMLPLRAALLEAQRNNILVFASTSNQGSHEPVAWPASDSRFAIGVHSCNDMGTSPSVSSCKPSDNGYNFMAVGEDLLVHRLSKQGGGFELLSGSSLATPVVVSVAALVLAFVWEGECKNEREEVKKEVVLEDLLTLGGMARVLRVIGEKTPGGYWSVGMRLFWGGYRAAEGGRGDPLREQKEARRWGWGVVRGALAY